MWCLKAQKIIVINNSNTITDNRIINKSCVFNQRRKKTVLFY